MVELSKKQEDLGCEPVKCNANQQWFRLQAAI